MQLSEVMWRCYNRGEGRLWRHSPPLCAYNGHTTAVKRLIAVGVAAQERTESGETPLHIVAGAGHLGVSQYLTDPGVPIEGKDDFGNTPSIMRQEMAMSKL
ncbi:uncharacterized protein ATNIH1004_008567 [Aspergillus tanneri]|uniref:Uncharacterized protein n=1 Tax=Aspergillus tanneri TaxID=1220188 RepID=A0A5M9MF35_9EURO|nr:uncharacterized protein ATNIH1004_008567 [Aspergillus tanneri]KAA8644366.1 hypothetical protein ATNIH1004_008567 [Aspergillus tanneri]